MGRRTDGRMDGWMWEIIKKSSVRSTKTTTSYFCCTLVTKPWQYPLLAWQFLSPLIMIEILTPSELQKSFKFQASATGGRRQQDKKKSIWNLSRSVFALDCLSFLLCLLSILCFKFYWLVIDSKAVFFNETAHYLNTFFIFVVSLYFMVRKLGIWARIIELAWIRITSGSQPWQMLERHELTE